MSTPVLVIRLLFILISALIGSCYTTTVWPGGFTPLHLGVGILGGALFAGLIIALERGVKQFSLRAFNLSALGILFGYLMGSVVVLTVVSIFDFAGQGISLQAITIVKGTIYLVAVYFGMVLTAQASDQLHLSIP
ncbi:MAG: hypothetical protein KDK48_03545, partial [Chlamydiia bacterium]|nr:hypothetical protein [Chlamydiia bacterium]